MKLPLLFAALLLLAAPPSDAIPQAFEPPEGTLRADGSVLLKPREVVALQFDVLDGKISNLRAVPWKTTETENVIKISLERSGGVATKLGPISQIVDTLTLRCSVAKPLTARCEYITLSSPYPEKTKLTTKGAGWSKAFRFGVSQVTISEIQLRQP